MRDMKTEEGKGNNVPLIRNSTLLCIPKKPLAFAPRVFIMHMPTRCTKVPGGGSGVGRHFSEMDMLFEMTPCGKADLC